jgi:hypothetical protein
MYSRGVPRLTPSDLSRFRATLYRGDELGSDAVRRLLEEIESAWSDLARRRVEFATKAAAALEKRLADVTAFNRGGCPLCKDAEARAFLKKLKRIADEKSSKGRD